MADDYNMHQIVVTDAPLAPGAAMQVKAYCGATSATAERHQMSGATIAGMHQGARPTVAKAPLPAWVDQAMAHRVHNAVVGSELRAEDPMDPGVGHLKRKFHSALFVFRVLAILFAVSENLCCYSAYIEIAAPEDKLYNKFEAHSLGIPNLDLYLLLLALANTAYLFIFWVMIVVIKMDIYRTMTSLRLLISLPSGGLCVLIVLYGEHTKVSPFFCSLLVLLHFAVCIFNEYKIRQARTRRTPRLWFVLLFLVGIATVMWSQMFVVNAVFFLRDKDCPATSNLAMPVYIKEIAEWHCVKWKTTHYIVREPSPEEMVREVFCSTSFRVFDEQDSRGRLTHSKRAHYVRCPSRCQDLNLGSTVTGCTVYHLDSSICSAAVHMGVIEPNKGGVVKVIGRLPPPNGRYERCLRNSILSGSADFAKGRLPQSAVGDSMEGLMAPSTETQFGSEGQLEYGVAIPYQYGSTNKSVPVYDQSSAETKKFVEEEARQAAKQAAEKEEKERKEREEKRLAAATEAGCDCDALANGEEVSEVAAAKNNTNTSTGSGSDGNNASNVTGVVGPNCTALCDGTGIGGDSQLLAGGGSSLDNWAFYFQVEGMEDNDMITLRGWEMTSTPQNWKPWESFTADVTYKFGGTQKDVKVVLGPPPPESEETAEIQLNFCVASNQTAEIDCSTEH